MNIQSEPVPFAAEITSACPCTGRCSTVLGDDVCRGCLRSLNEIIGWPQMSEEERCAVNRRIVQGQ